MDDDEIAFPIVPAQFPGHLSRHGPLVKGVKNGPSAEAGMAGVSGLRLQLVHHHRIHQHRVVKLH
jgi:hypothetical protein